MAETCILIPMLPVAITLGFSGPRRWFEPGIDAGIDSNVFTSEVEEWLHLLSSHAYVPTMLPVELASLVVPASAASDTPLDADTCLRIVMDLCGKQAMRHSRFFKSAALISVGTHCLATVCAVICR